MFKLMIFRPGQAQRIELTFVAAEEALAIQLGVLKANEPVETELTDQSKPKGKGLRVKAGSHWTEGEQ